MSEVNRENFAGPEQGYIIATWNIEVGRWQFRAVTGGPLLSDDEIHALGLDAALEGVAKPALISYSQRDPRWSNEVYAGGSTFGAAGCFVVSIADMVSLAYPETILPPEVAGRLRDAGAFNGNLLSNPSRIPTAYPRLTWDGVIHYRNKAADMDVVKQRLSHHGAVISEVAFNPNCPVYWTDSSGAAHWNQHFVVITRALGDDVEIADPWEGGFTMLTESRYFKAGWPKNASRVITGLRLVGIGNGG